MKYSIIPLSLIFANVSAFSPSHPIRSTTNSIHKKSSSSSSQLNSVPPLQNHEQNQASFDPISHTFNNDSRDMNLSSPLLRPETAIVSMASLLPILALPQEASATVANAPNAIPSALAAYGHYISLVGIVGCLVAERLLIKPNMKPEEEDTIALVDTAYGVFGLLIAYTGYLRAVSFEKGFEFYAHEPLFWLKIAFVGVFGASSFFNTTKIIQRAISRRNGAFEPMGEKLAKRMIQICNAELVAVSIIPLTATFMARGVAYSNDIPWEVEAGLAALVFAGLSFKYIKEAITFEDN